MGSVEKTGLLLYISIDPAMEKLEKRNYKNQNREPEEEEEEYKKRGSKKGTSFYPLLRRELPEGIQKNKPFEAENEETPEKKNKKKT